MFPPGGDSHLFQYHLGIAYIQALLVKHGYNSRQVIPPSESTLEECADQLIATNAPIIGFSCYDTNCYLIRYLVMYIKRKRPATIIIVGGPNATFSDEIILNHIPEVDIVVRFEGEITTLELVSHIFSGKPLDCLDDIKGISFRRHNGAIVRTPDRPLFSLGTGNKEELDGFPSPYLEGIIDGSEGAGVLSARGCTHKCTYCNFAAMSRQTIRFHSIDRIISELKLIHNILETKKEDSSIPKVIQIQDDAFTLNTRRAKEMCRQIIKERLRLNLACLCRADNLDEELIALLQQAGFIDIGFGLESAVSEVLRNIKKVCSIPPKSGNEDYAPEKRFLSKVRQGISLAKKYNMRTGVSIILGLPGESFAQGLQTLEFIKKMEVDVCSHNFLVVHPGTEIFNKAGNYGINVKFSDSLLRYETTHAYPVARIPYLRNSSLYDYSQNVAQTLLKTFAGGRTLKSISGGGVTSALVKVNNPGELSNILKWLSYFLAVDGNVFVFVNEKISHDELAEIKHVNSTTFLPTQRRYILKTLSNKNGEVAYKMLEGKFIKWKFQFPLVQFIKYREFLAKKEHPNTDVFPILYLKARTDVNVLSAMSEMSALKAEYGKEDAIPCLNGVFLDGCRWSRTLCPALELKQVIITETGEIRPCMTGPALGVIGDSIQEVRERTQDLYTKLRKKRKCDACPVDSQCGKCLLPYPLTPQEYCEVQWYFSNIAGIVISSKLANTIYTLPGDYLNK